MSDERLQALKRRFQETQSSEDGAALLGALIRSGQLARERALLAASFGDSSALALFGDDDVPRPTFGPEDLHRFPESRFSGSMRREDPWLKLVLGLGRDPYLRLLLALGRVALPEWPGPDAAWGREVFAASEAYVRAPSLAGLRALRAFDRTSPARESLCTPRHSGLGSDFPIQNLADRIHWSYKGVLRDPGFGAFHAVSGVQSWASMLEAETEPDLAPMPERYLSMALGMILCSALNGAMFVVGSQRALAALQSEVSPWLLQRGDPLGASHGKIASGARSAGGSGG